MLALRWNLALCFVASTTIAVPALAQRPPFLEPVSDMTAREGSTATQTLTATDADGHAIFFQKVTGPPYMIVETIDPGAGTGTGRIVLTPGFADIGVAVPASVRASDGVLLGNVRAFLITVTHVNRPPVADPGGPYSGTPSVPVEFDGTRSADPDGEALTYVWQFGDQSTGSGPTPVHTFAIQGVYVVLLTVSDGLLSASAGTVATIRDEFLARAFTSRADRILRLRSGKPTWSVQIEPVEEGYDNAEVDLSSIRMEYAGKTPVSVIPARVVEAVSLDTDGNGVREVTATFSKEDLRALFSNVSGLVCLPVTVEGRLAGGGTFRAWTEVAVRGSKSDVVAAVRPNPLHAFGWITVEVLSEGALEMRIFDARGRLVRTLVDERVSGPVVREVAFDGRDEGGAPVASGIYYLRVVTASGAETRKLAFVK